jgi:hypothetical protein
MLFTYAGLEYDAGRKTGAEITSILLQLFYYGKGHEFLDQKKQQILPQNVVRAILDLDYLWDLSTYDSEMLRGVNNPVAIQQEVAEVENIQQQIDLRLRDIFDWGREYWDKLPPQCFPSSAESE